MKQNNMQYRNSRGNELNPISLPSIQPRSQNNIPLGGSNMINNDSKGQVSFARPRESSKQIEDGDVLYGSGNNNLEAFE